MDEQDRIWMEWQQREMATILFDRLRNRIPNQIPDTARDVFVEEVHDWITWSGAPNAPDGSGVPGHTEIMESLDSLRTQLEETSELLRDIKFNRV